MHYKNKHNNSNKQIWFSILKFYIYVFNKSKVLYINKLRIRKELQITLIITSYSLVINLLRNLQFNNSQIYSQYPRKNKPI